MAIREDEHARELEEQTKRHSDAAADAQSKWQQAEQSGMAQKAREVITKGGEMSDSTRRYMGLK